MAKFTNKLTLSKNGKGVYSLDTVVGCEFGIKKYGDRGCYGLCYARKIANFRGFDFSKSVIRDDFSQIDHLAIGLYDPISGERLPAYGPDDRRLPEDAVLVLFR